MGTLIKGITWGILGSYVVVQSCRKCLMYENDSRYRVLVSCEKVLIRVVMLRETAKDGYLGFVGNDL